MVMSRKYRLWSKGSATSGDGTTSKDLAVICQPYGMMVSDCNAAAFSGTAGPTPSTLPSSLNQTVYARSNSPYDTSSFNAGKIAGRIVSYKFRIRYTGTALNKGGTYTGLQEPTHDSLALNTVAQLQSHTTCKRVNVADLKKGQWFEISYRPSDPDDIAFVDSIARTNAYDGVYKTDGHEIAWDAYPFIAVYISCPTAGSTFDFEQWAVVEYAGPNVPGKSITPPDPQGYACVVASFAEVDSIDPMSTWMTQGKGSATLRASEFGVVGNGYTIRDFKGRQSISQQPRKMVTAGDWRETAGTVADYVVNAASQLMSAAAPALLDAGVRYVRNRANRPRVELIE